MMNDKDLIKALRRITVETGSLVCLGCGHEHSCSVHGCAIINKAAARLQVLTEAQAVKLENALDMIRAERCRQDSLWGDQSGNHPFEWISILGEEFGELCEAVNETFFQNAAHPDRGGFEKIVKEATQVAAVAVAIIETVQIHHIAPEAEVCTEATEIVRCKDCKRVYYKDMSAYCPHRVGPCSPDGFCDRGVQGG